MSLVSGISQHHLSWSPTMIHPREMRLMAAAPAVAKNFGMAIGREWRGQAEKDAPKSKAGRERRNN